MTATMYGANGGPVTPDVLATIAVLWSVRPPNACAAVNGRTIVHEPTNAPCYDALVDAHSRALSTVNSDIAAAIRLTLRP